MTLTEITHQVTLILVIGAIGGKADGELKGRASS